MKSCKSCSYRSTQDEWEICRQRKKLIKRNLDSGAECPHYEARKSCLSCILYSIKEFLCPKKDPDDCEKFIPIKNCSLKEVSMSICDGCVYKPKNFSYCHKSETMITYRYCHCSSYSKDGLNEKERAINAYRKAKEENNESKK